MEDLVCTSGLDVKFTMTVVPSDQFRHQVALVQHSCLWFFPRYDPSEGRGAGFPRDVFRRLPRNVVPANVYVVFVSIIFDVEEKLSLVTLRIFFAMDGV